MLGVAFQPGQAGDLTPASCPGCSVWRLDSLRGQSSTGHSERATRWVTYSQGRKGQLDLEVSLTL